MTHINALKRRIVLLAGVGMIGCILIVLFMYFPQLFLFNPLRDNLSIRDEDGDGILDPLEEVYGTDPHIYDSDSDGTSDGEELSLGRNPLKPGPDDSVDVHYGSAVQNPQTETEKYLASLPNATPRDQLLSINNIESYIETRAVPLLSEVSDTEIILSPEDSLNALRVYIGTVDIVRAPLKNLTGAHIASAYQQSYGSGKYEHIDAILATIRSAREELERTPTPLAAKEVHGRLVAVHRSLHENVMRLRNMNDDFIGGIIGAKNLLALSEHIKMLDEDLTSLEGKAYSSL